MNLLSLFFGLAGRTKLIIGLIAIVSFTGGGMWLYKKLFAENTREVVLENVVEQQEETLEMIEESLENRELIVNRNASTITERSKRVKVVSDSIESAVKNNDEKVLNREFGNLMSCFKNGC